ncbi:putative U-box domain-containing protein 58 [Cardamine amara subsp. amara]|uniref:RING-type E3 ubiquitin transferase n=1 Tax=Cardamine amara subsp. amara TaxID=228776 RepID=A0ABD1BWR3_CARAN
MDSRRSFNYVSSIEENRVLAKSKSLLNWLTQRNFDKIKDEIVLTVKASPSASILKSLASIIFDMAMVENSYVLFARLCVELFHELPPLPSDESHGQITTFERQFLRKCQNELENSSPKTDIQPLVYVDESHFWRFIKTVRVLAEVFKNKLTTETTRKSIIQVLMNPIFPPDRNIDAMNFFLASIGKLADFKFSVQSSRAVELESSYSEEVRLRKEVQDALAKTKEEVEMMERLLKSYKEEQGKLQLQAQALEQKYDTELQLRKETETILAIELVRIENLKRQVETLENERDDMRLKAEEFESKYNCELVLRKDSEIALDKERKEVEEMNQRLETCLGEQESLTSQVRAWQDMYEQESRLRKETEDTLSREKKELELVKGLHELYRLQADAMREERDNALKKVQEIEEKREPPASFLCPITQEVMKDPHITADGFTYEAEAIKKWFNTGHKTSPWTNLNLSHLTLVRNHALRSAIEDWFKPTGSQ